MAKIANHPRSFERLHHVRARLRRASCMGSDTPDHVDHNDSGAGEEDFSEDETRTAHPFARPSMSPAPAGPQDGATSSSYLAAEPAVAHTQVGEADPQLQSAFFNRLPPEVRRMIYTHVWRLSNPTLALHIHAACDGARLTHTPCCTTSSPFSSSSSSSSSKPPLFSMQEERRDEEGGEARQADGEEAEEDDPMMTDPWPGWRGRNQPPRWFWHAWGLRMRWGSPHWRCQAEAMLSWRAGADGTCADEKGLVASGSSSSYMPVFLTSRRV
jgi:hypothetical protein